jgi:hypothetical protein
MVQASTELLLASPLLNRNHTFVKSIMQEERAATETQSAYHGTQCEVRSGEVGESHSHTTPKLQDSAVSATATATCRPGRPGHSVALSCGLRVRDGPVTLVARGPPAGLLGPRGFKS